MICSETTRNLLIFGFKTTTDYSAPTRLWITESIVADLRTKMDIKSAESETLKNNADEMAEGMRLRQIHYQALSRQVAALKKH